MFDILLLMDIKTPIISESDFIRVHTQISQIRKFDDLKQCFISSGVNEADYLKEVERRLMVEVHANKQ